MYSVIWFLKRKPGISFEQFKAHYESSHAILGQHYFGHLLCRYDRQYKRESWGGAATGAQGGTGFGPKPWEYDCITSWATRDERDFNEIMRLLTVPDIAQIFYDDEEHFLDRAATMLIKCDSYDTGPGDGAGTLMPRHKAAP